MTKTLAKTFAIALGLSFAAALPAMAQQEQNAYDAIAAQDWARAEAELTKALAANPDDPFKLLNLAYVMRATGREDEAVAIYEKIVTLDENPLAELSNGKAKRVKSIAKASIAALEPQ